MVDEREHCTPRDWRLGSGASFAERPSGVTDRPVDVRSRDRSVGIEQENEGQGWDAVTVTMTLLIIALKTLNLLFGGLITFYAYRAYSRTGTSSMAAFAIGFGTITLGTLFAGVVDQLLPLPANVAIAVEALFMTGGFLVILYSLYE